MSGITRKQARLFKKQIRKLYGRNYIPLITPDNALSIGDILIKKRDIIPIADSSVFKKESISFVEGKPFNLNITSSSKINLTTKLKGSNILTEHFKINEAGLVVNFSSANQMFLKVNGLRQQSIKDFMPLRKELLKRYARTELSSKVYIVRGLVYADKYYLQYSGTNGGSLAFNLKGKVESLDAELNADFSLQWRKDVGYSMESSKGGVLAYRVSGVRLKRHLISSDLHNLILNGMPEEDVLNELSLKDREKLIEKDAIEIIDLTDEVILHNLEYSELG